MIDKIIQTESGQITGIHGVSPDILIFKGVPYAAPPVGELRFKRPQPIKHWEGVRNAETFSHICPQFGSPKESFYYKEFYNESNEIQDEDCLYLNIWTGAKKADDNLPVLFWIHGGAFLNGYGHEKEFDGEEFCKKGVILVTINYRLGVFGFLAHPWLNSENDEGISGNYGIYDQIAALEWVRRNIASFGGDPEKITVFGQSAGCISSQILISTDITRGKIRRAILQSGGGIFGFLRSLSNMEDAEEIGKQFVQKLRARTLEELRSISAQKLLEASKETGNWRPIVDGYLFKESCDELALKGRQHDIEYMIGSTGDELGQESARKWRDAAVRWAMQQNHLNRAPAYVYFFNRKMPGDNAGAFHSSELWYEFETLHKCWRPLEPCDEKLAHIISTYWANFAATGNPNDIRLPIWTPYTEKEPKVMCLDRQTYMKTAIKI